ncbi:hypothetical protein [Treponema sp.]|uniref:hypothetical protein n=1 Tax=Treponema sp. TaxID=166 RepID=UPI00388E77EA
MKYIRPFTFLSVLLLFSFFGCDDTLSSPQTSLSSNLNTTFSAPQNLTATNGTKRRITLQWEAVAKAERYDIYAADTPFDEFVQVGETTKTSFSYENLSAGVKKYLKVQAVNYSGDVSAFSSIVLGSTLAKPVITYVEEDSDNSSATVYWWVKNCDSTTYSDSVRLEVRCLDSNKSEVFSDVVYGGTESYTFTSLSSATKYYYQVAAYIITDTAVTEESDLVDLTTAHCLIPEPPVNFEAEKGLSGSEIILTWQLPDFVEVNNNSLYENHPVYFKVFRKVKDSSDDYETICDYAGTLNSNPDCFTIENYTGSDVTVSSDYPSYIPLSKVTYVDSDGLSNGRQYEYKVQSYTDDSTDAVTSNTLSAATDYGWLCPVPSLQVSTEYTENETAFTSFTVKFTAGIQELTGGPDYIYVLEEIKTDFETESDTSNQLKISSSLAAINNYERIFENPAGEKGYYSYRLYVLNADDSENASSDYASLAIISSSSTSKITVTDDKDAVPQIENFTITDGYSDKYVLSWTYDETCTYSLDWIEYDSNGTGTEGSYELSSTDVAQARNESTFSFEHAAASGSRRLYSLTADKGLRTTEDYGVITETLGTPQPVFAEPYYTTITVSWDKVQKAENYKITAYYNDDEGTTANYLVNENTVCSQSWNTTEFNVTADDSENPSKYTCVITKPNGYSDSLWSGKPVKFIVKAVSDVDSTESGVAVCTLGPALLGTAAGSKQADYISLSWNKIEGAKGYLIQRTRYTDASGTQTSDSSFDKYYYDGTKLNVSGEAVNSACAEVTLSDSVYTLKDMYYESGETGSYDNNQAKISWGLPYGYVVIPVLNADDFAFENAVTLESSSVVQYSNLSASKGASYGYGLNLRACKSESGTTQTLEWDLPYHGSSLQPSVYYRTAGSSENSWIKMTNANLSVNDTTVSFSPVTVTDAYEYAVAYSKTSTNITLPPSFVNDSETCGLSVMETDGTNYNYTGVELEKLNKGYLLAVGFSAGYGGKSDSGGNYIEDDYYYSEKVEWDEWDYDNRSIGPSSAYISIKNYNLSSDWTKVAVLGEDLHYSSAETLENTTVNKSGNVGIYLTPQTVSTADSVTNGTMLNTAGPLMVLRDAKHYYSLTLERGEVNATLGSDDSVYGYRQLSDAEIARAAMLVLSYGFYINDGGLANYSNAGSQFKYGGSGSQTSSNGGVMSFTSRSAYGLTSGYFGKYHASYSLSGNFAPLQLTPGGISAAYIGLTAGSSFDGGFRIKGNADNYLYQFAQTDSIEVATADSSIPLNYSATISFICEDQDDLTLKITRNGTTTTLCDTTDNTVRKYWCPMQIHDNQSYVITQSYYGWWTE